MDKETYLGWIKRKHQLLDSIIIHEKRGDFKTAFDLRLEDHDITLKLMTAGKRSKEEQDAYLKFLNRFEKETFNIDNMGKDETYANILLQLNKKV